VNNLLDNNCNSTVTRITFDGSMRLKGCSKIGGSGFDGLKTGDSRDVTVVGGFTGFFWFLIT